MQLKKEQDRYYFETLTPEEEFKRMGYSPDNQDINTEYIRFFLTRLKTGKYNSPLMEKYWQAYLTEIERVEFGIGQDSHDNILFRIAKNGINNDADKNIFRLAVEKIRVYALYKIKKNPNPVEYRIVYKDFIDEVSFLKNFINDSLVKKIKPVLREALRYISQKISTTSIPPYYNAEFSLLQDRIKELSELLKP